jgi:hypothetical protein
MAEHLPPKTIAGLVRERGKDVTENVTYCLLYLNRILSAWDEACGKVSRRVACGTWGAGDIFTGRLPADVCYWEATAKTRERGINAGL